MDTEYIDEKKYTYVLSKDYNNEYDQQLDISIFEIEEWEKLLEISKVFEEWVLKIKSYSDSEYETLDKDLHKAVFYLYYSPFCQFGNFSDLYSSTASINNIYKVVLIR